jgi:hypothetical protein
MAEHPAFREIMSLALFQRKPRHVYIEVREDQLEVLQQA